MARDVAARLRLALAGVAFLPLCSCQLVFPTVAEDAAAPSGDASTRCGPVDDGYHDMATKACWSTYHVLPTIASNPSFSGGSFDGRWVYFASFRTGLVVRYDSHASFTADGSWSSYAPIQGQAYTGVVFDGRYMYFVPGFATPVNFIRYDTTADFEASSSWQSFRLSSVQYQGGTFDGRYIYFAAYQDSAANNSGRIARYDTHQGFTSPGSWSTFDATRIPGSLGAMAEPDDLG